MTLNHNKCIYVLHTCTQSYNIHCTGLDMQTNYAMWCEVLYMYMGMCFVIYMYNVHVWDCDLCLLSIDTVCGSDWHWKNSDHSRQATERHAQ